MFILLDLSKRPPMNLMTTSYLVVDRELLVLQEGHNLEATISKMASQFLFRCSQFLNNEFSCLGTLLYGAINPSSPTIRPVSIGKRNIAMRLS